MPNFIYRGPDGFQKFVDTASLAAEFSGAPPPNDPNALNDEMTEIGLLADRGWTISGAGVVGLAEAPQVSQSDIGLTFDWVPAVANEHVIMERGAAPAGDFCVYARLDLAAQQTIANVNFAGIFVARMAGATVEQAVFAGRGSAAQSPSYGGKTFTSSSQAAGNFITLASPMSLWTRLRYIAAENRMWAGFSGDGRSWLETRTDILTGGGANRVGIALLSNQVTGAPRLAGTLRSFRVVEGAADLLTPLPSSVFETP